MTRVALVNPPWSFEGSVYFGCREPHLPIELGCARALLERAGHEVTLVDAHLHRLTFEEMVARATAARPDLTVVTTAPTYLFWRCPPPELRVPGRAVERLRASGEAGAIVAVGPHPSATPRAAVRKLAVDAAVIGECEEVLVDLAAAPRREWDRVASIARVDDRGEVHVQGGPRSSRIEDLPALAWSDEDLARHHHHHHRFDAAPEGPGAEIEWTRGCPYHCTFCNKEQFRNAYRKRPLAVVLDELDRLIARGVRYVYFIDEIFLPDRALLEALAARTVRFGVQLRIDNWTPETLALLGRAGCCSIEAGVESVTEVGRSLMAKRCRLTTEDLAALLIEAKRHVPFVQANLIDVGVDGEDAVEAWRERLVRAGVWPSRPVPMFPYPGSPEYAIRWGTPDDDAWERAHAEYVARWSRFSDIQEQAPAPLAALEEGLA